MKKQMVRIIVMFLFLILVGNLMKVTADEIVGTILFPPTRQGTSLISDFYIYIIDSTGNSIMDKRMIAAKSGGTSNTVFDILTEYYLKQGTKFTFEDNKLDKFDDFGIERLLSIEINGKMIELTEMFPLNEVRSNLPYLWTKLVREGRTKQ
jgi:hypothetical protein